MMVSQMTADAFMLPLKALFAPRQTFPKIVARRTIVPALVLATLTALANVAVLVPRLDYDSAITEQLERQSQTRDMTPHQKEEAVASGRKIGTVGSYASAVLLPTMIAVVAAFFLWLGFKVAATPTAYVPVLAVCSAGLLPLALRRLLTIPAIFSRDLIPVASVTSLLPSNLACLSATPGRWTSVLAAVDLFNLWAVVLLSVGMQQAAGVSLRRAGIVTASLWLAYVAVFHLALPSFSGARP